MGATVQAAVAAALPAPTPTPTPDLDATVAARMAATIAAMPAPTLAPAATPQPSLRAMFRQAQPAVVRIDTNTGTGSGVIFDTQGQNGYVITNHPIMWSEA